MAKVKHTGFCYELKCNQIGAYNCGIQDKVDAIDLMIFDCMVQFSAWNGCRNFVENEKIYFNFTWKNVLNRAPMIGLRDRTAIYKRIQKLVDCQLIERHENNKQRNVSFFCFGEKYNQFMFNEPVAEKQQVAQKEAEPVAQKQQTCCSKTTDLLLKNNRPVAQKQHNDKDILYDTTNNDLTNNDNSSTNALRPQKKTPKNNLPKKMATAFDEHLKKNGLPKFDWKTNQAKKFGSLKNLREAIIRQMVTKDNRPSNFEFSDNQIMDGWNHFLEVAAKANDGWFLRSHYTPSGLISQFEKIINAYHAEKQQPKRTGHNVNSEKRRVSQALFG